MSAAFPPALVPGQPLRSLLPESTWVRLAESLLERHGLPSADVAMFSTGSDVVLGSRAHVVKVSNPNWRAQMVSEREWNQHLRGRLPLRIAEPLAWGEIDQWPYLITERIEGPSLAEVWPTLDRSTRLRLAADLGTMMAQLHAVEPPDGHAARWPAFVAKRHALMDERLAAQGADERWRSEIQQFVQRTARPERPLVCLHTELLGHHVLLESRDRLRPTALIDLADAEVGHPDYDVAALVEFVFMGEAGCLDACLGAYGWSEAERGAAGSQRLAAWALLHRFSNLPRMLEAVGSPAPTNLDALVERLFRW
ncbi:MAG: aminoglycoside phosphotransferase family protein [Myxococcota bacterium]